ncbi:MAG: response regulator [Bacteroidales bacterium]|nr:response regulator [Bacteroidales bacterium]
MLGNKKKEIAELKQKITTLETENARLTNIIHKTGIEDDPQNSIVLLSKALELNGIGLWAKYASRDNIWISSIAGDVMGFKESTALTLEHIKLSIIPEDRPEFEKALNDVSQGFRIGELELKIARYENESREFRNIVMHITQFSGTLENTEGNILLGTIRDSTKIEKTRRDLIRAKERAEESERLKNTLMTNISHDIRTPMNSIIGFSELLNIGNLAYDKRLEYVKTIKNQGLLLLKMIDDIVELTQMETGKVTIRKSPCNIDFLLNEILTIFNQYKVSQNKEHIDIKINYPEKRGMVIYTDPGRLQQLISSLITNSIRFTEKGSVEIGYKPITEQRIEFFVRDTGAGLSRELQKRIFNKVSEDEPGPGRSESTGLGLSIARNLIRLMGGKIWVESELGQGSTFYFTIPYEEVPETYHEMAPDEEFVIPSYTWKDKVILIVEDDDINFKFLEAVLHDTSSQVLHAINGFQAVELCRSINKIDLVLMDIKMPEMDGFEATRQIRSFNRKVPIIAQTAFVMEHELKKCHEAGCNDQLTKPIDIKEFFEKVDRYLKHD